MFISGVGPISNPAESRSSKLALAAMAKLQLKRLREQGVTVVARAALNILKLTAATPLLLLIRLLRPFYAIRIVQFRFERIGHMATEPELYLSRRDVGIIDSSDLELFYTFNFYKAPIANQQLFTMWKRSIRIVPWVKWIDVANRLIPGGDRHGYDFGEPRDWDLAGVLIRTKPHIALTAEEEQKGFEELREMGIPDGAPFVCFIARDATYLTAHQPQEAEYNARFSYRDADIDNYFDAIAELAHRGYYGLRMGAVVSKPLIQRHPMVIDYAVKMRSDFMDVFLISKCAFFIGDTGGLFNVAQVFRRPKVFTNLAPMNHAVTWGPHDLLIFKKYWSRKQSRYLTFSEVYELGIWDCTQVQLYDQMDVEVHQNTPEEIKSVACEMDARLKGVWESSAEDEELQEQFWSLFTGYDQLNRVIVSRVGAEFLRENKELFVKRGT